MSTTWIAVIGTCAAVFGLKYLGHTVPAKFLENPRIIRVNQLMPIVLLTAMVAIQSFSTKSKVMIDHRAAGLVVAIIAVSLKAPYPVIVVSAAITSALVYRYKS